MFSQSGADRGAAQSFSTFVSGLRVYDVFDSDRGRPVAALPVGLCQIIGKLVRSVQEDQGYGHDHLAIQGDFDSARHPNARDTWIFSIEKYSNVKLPNYVKKKKEMSSK